LSLCKILHVALFQGIERQFRAPQLPLVGSQYNSAAYLYLEPAGGWQTTSHPNTTILSTDPYQEQFGYSVAMMGKTIAIGDPGEDAVNGGAAYVLQMQ
jgi:hypothetical protein